ncbi:DUF1697 domain-containing protein [Mesobacterium pallidum]|uniref:DUF1697 domain-containing protein n=1 Tax=Mesobacterium pallidum TaxID=2872037 RepID=UPI0023432137|nr:DUF1697 domain-containing protein [Mesobacterium pallidum]
MRRVALLRGINVGGAKKIPMAALKEAAVNLGWRNVQSYIASGNLVFEADGDGLAEALEVAIAHRFGFDVPVLVLEAAEMRAARDDCPFAPADDRHVHAAFLFADAAPDMDLFDKWKAPGDGFAQQGRVAWLHCPGGFGRSKLAERFEKLAGAPLTARNLATVGKLNDMLDAAGAE